MFISGTSKSISAAKHLAPVHFKLLLKNANDRIEKAFYFSKEHHVDAESVIPAGVSYSWKKNKLLVAGSKKHVEATEMCLNYFSHQIKGEASSETSAKRRKKRQISQVSRGDSPTSNGKQQRLSHQCMYCSKEYGSNYFRLHCTKSAKKRKRIHH